MKPFLTVDFGAGSLKLAEFETNEAGGLTLKNFAIRPLGLEGSQETSREKVMLTALNETLAEKGIKSKNVNVCAPGFHVFSKFVKLPPVDASKVGQIIQYEAQQNVPFPLAEVVWDYQILGTAPSGELEVLLVAVKSEIVEGLFRVVEQGKLKLNLCDASPAALCNAFRYNYSDLEDCSMLLDIGAKTSNLLFFEKGKIFSRSINLGANTITQDFATESKLKFDEAEKIKIQEGFVSLGGAYEEPENPHQAAISKIARQFMTKLHIQVNQTLQFYRGQQGGSAPQRLFLSGGASLMPYTAQFFAEKLNVPVEYFNPFRNLSFDPSVNLEDLSRHAHAMGEVVGLGLRNLANCPVEMNLMPESTLRWQTFNEKKPYLIATVFSLALVAGAVGLMFGKLASNKENQVRNLEPKVSELTAKSNRFNDAYKKLKTAKGEADQMTTWLNQRYYWADFITEMKSALLRSESAVKKKWAVQKSGVDTGIWIDQMISANSAGALGAGAMPGMEGGVPNPVNPYNPYNRMPEPGMPGMPGAAAPEGGAVPPAGGATPAVNVNTNMITMVCRAISLTSVDASANRDIAYAVQEEIKTSPLVDPTQTTLDGNISDEVNGTFTFTVKVAPLHPPLTDEAPAN